MIELARATWGEESLIFGLFDGAISSSVVDLWNFFFNGSDGLGLSDNDEAECSRAFK